MRKPSSRKSARSAKHKREGAILVELCQKHGYVFMPKPKVGMSFNPKTGVVSPHLEYRIAVPEDSALAALLPRKAKAPCRGSIPGASSRPTRWRSHVLPKS